MSFLQKVLAKEIKLPEEIEGVKIVQRPKDDFGSKTKGGGRGMHWLDDEDEIKSPEDHKLHQLVEDALTKGFQTIYIYNQESTEKKPHLYLIK